MALVEAAARLSSFDPGAAIDSIPRAYNFAADILERNLAAGRASKPAYIDPRGPWTYGVLAERVARFGDALRSLGIRREERSAELAPDYMAWGATSTPSLACNVAATSISVRMPNP